MAISVVVFWHVRAWYSLSHTWYSYTFGGSTSIRDSKPAKIIYYVFVTNIKAKEVFK